MDILGDLSKPHMVFAVSRRHSLGSVITRSVDPGARWGHSAFWDQERNVMNEALMFKGVVETPFEEWFKKYSAWQFFAVNVPNPEDGVMFQRKHAALKTPYDYQGATSVPWRTSWQDESRLYCSEKDTLSVHRAGRILCRDPQRGIHPHDFWRFAT